MHIPPTKAKPNCVLGLFILSALAVRQLAVKRARTSAKRKLVPSLRALLPSVSKLTRNRPRYGPSFSAPLAPIFVNNALINFFEYDILILYF